MESSSVVIAISKPTSTIKYTTEVLKGIGQCLKLQIFYPSFNLNIMTRTNIIALRIRKRGKSDRRSRPGQRLFHHIHSIVSKHGQIMKASNYRTIGEWNKTIKCIKTHDTNKCKQIMKIGLFNCQSAVIKTHTIKSELIINDLDILGFTETWIKEDDLTTPNCHCPSGYKIKTTSRINRICVGIGIIHHEDLEIKTNKTYDFNMMEFTNFKIIQKRSKD